jgi:hypothetical protein
MRRATLLLASAIAAIALLPGIAAAQCEGGTSAGGYYLRSGGYVPGGCSYTNATTPGRLYPSGAQPQVSTNPALGSSRLPGQVQPSGLIPVNNTDMGPAPSYLNSQPALTGSPSATTPSAGPGAAPAGETGVATLPPNTSTAMGPANILVEQANPSRTPATVSEVAGISTTATTGAGTATTPSLLPGQGPPSREPALTINRGTPSDQVFPGRLANPVTVTGVANSTTSAGGLSGAILPTQASPATMLGPATGTGQSAYGYGLPAAPAEVVNGPPPDSGPQPPPAPGRGGSTILGQ